MGSFPLSQLPLRSASPVLIPFSLLLSLFTPLLFSSVMWRVSCPFWMFNVFCQHSVDVPCEMFYRWMVLVDVFVGEGEHHVSLLCQLYPLFFFFFFWSFVFRATPVAYGGFQARGLIGAVAAGLHQCQSNARSEPHLQPTP